MAHLIEQTDKIVSTVQCWHGLEEIVSDINLENSGLNWEIKAEPIFVRGVEVDGHKALVRDDTGNVLHVAKDSYGIIQNSRVWEAIENSLQGVNHKLVTVGSIKGNRVVFMSIVLDGEQEYMVNRDKFQNHITFLTSHNGQYGLEAYDCSTRVCCANTLNWSRGEKGLLNLKVFHTKNNEIKIQNMEAHIEQLLIKRKEFYDTIEGMMARPMTLDKANAVLAGWIGKGNELSTRAENQIESMLGLFQNGIGNNGQTVADLFNGVTQHYTREASENKAKLFVSSEFGTAGDKKLDFYEHLLTDAEIDRLAAMGKRSLELATAE